MHKEYLITLIMILYWLFWDPLQISSLFYLIHSFFKHQHLKLLRDRETISTMYIACICLA
jgi:hypothetical protein